MHVQDTYHANIRHISCLFLRIVYSIEQKTLWTINDSDVFRLLHVYVLPWSLHASLFSKIKLVTEMSHTDNAFFTIDTKQKKQHLSNLKFMDKSKWRTIHIRDVWRAPCGVLHPIAIVLQIAYESMRCICKQLVYKNLINRGLSN
jgi:hypothetical protein